MIVELDIQPIEIDENQKLVINLHCSGSNSDWFRARRLLKKADVGNQRAKRELGELDGIVMVRLEEAS